MCNNKNWGRLLLNECNQFNVLTGLQLIRIRVFTNNAYGFIHQLRWPWGHMMLMVILTTCMLPLNGQETVTKQEEGLKHSIYADPFLPFFQLVIVNYGYQFHTKNEGIVGFLWSKAKTTPTRYLEYPGYVTSVGTVLGYRRYFYKGLHADYWLMPAYNSIYERNEDKYYKSFSIYNEIRLGYKFDVELFQLPFLINVQWPIGFSLLDTNKPESFRQVDKRDPVFYLFIPNIWIGYRF